MRHFFVICLEINLPVTVELLQGADILQLAFPQKIIYNLVKLLNLAFALSASRLCKMDLNTKPGKGKPQLFGNILFPVVEVAGVELSVTGNGFAESILYRGFLLVAVPLGCQGKA